MGNTKSSSPEPVKEAKRIFPDCQFCANSGYLIVEKHNFVWRKHVRVSDGWAETTVRCFCESGEWANQNSMSIKLAASRDDFRYAQYLNDDQKSSMRNAGRKLGIGFDGINWQR